MGAPALVEGQSKILKIRLIYILMLKHSALLPDSEPRGARLLTPRRRIENSSLANSNEKAKKQLGEREESPVKWSFHHGEALYQQAQSHRGSRCLKLKKIIKLSWASLVDQLVKNPPAMQETWVRSLGWEGPLEKGKATHSSILGLPWWLSW